MTPREHDALHSRAGMPTTLLKALVATAAGLVVDGVALYDVSTTNSATPTINSMTARFTSADEGKVCSLCPYTDTQLIGGVAGAWGTITKVNSPTQAVLSLSVAPGALTNAIFCYGTDNKNAFDMALAVAAVARSHVFLPGGIAMSTGQHNVPSGVLLHGCGNNPTGGGSKDFKHYGSSLVAARYYASGAFLSLGSFGSSDPRGAAIEHINVDCMGMTPRCVDGANTGRTERVFACTMVRSAGDATYYGGATGRCYLSHILHNNVANAAIVSGDGKFCDNIVVGNGSGFGRIKTSNPIDVLIHRNHLWTSNGTTIPGYGIWVSLNSGKTDVGAVTISDNEIDTCFGPAYYLSASGNAEGDGIAITGGHVFNNDDVPNNTGSVLKTNVSSGSTVRNFSFEGVKGKQSWKTPGLGQWQYLIDNTDLSGVNSAGTMPGFMTGGCNIRGVNNMYRNVTPDVDNVNMIMTGNGTIVKSTRV